MFWATCVMGSSSKQYFTSGVMISRTRVSGLALSDRAHGDVAIRDHAHESIVLRGRQHAGVDLCHDPGRRL